MNVIVSIVFPILLLGFSFLSNILVEYCQMLNLLVFLNFSIPFKFEIFLRILGEFNLSFLPNIGEENNQNEDADVSAEKDLTYFGQKIID